MSKRELNPQGNNAYKGESRSNALLADRFWIHKMSVDVEGRDLMVELKQDSLQELQEIKKKINVLGIIQSKYFENNNQVKIFKDYVEDSEGIKTDFFALFHTDDLEGQPHVYFFTAEDIKKRLYVRTEKDGKDYYIFKLAKNRSYKENKDIPAHIINDIIEEEISRTREYRNQEFIQLILEKSLSSDIAIEEDKEFLKLVDGKHITDKLYFALNYYNDFKAMLAWRVIDKISIQDRINENTYYNQFRVVSNNKEMMSFFSAIEISKTIKNKSRNFFKNVDLSKKKIDSIVSTLRLCNINQIEFGKTVINIGQKDDNQICECIICSYERLNFSGIYNFAVKNNQNDKAWNLLSKALVFFLVGKYEKSITAINVALTNALENKEPIPEFISKYNLDILYNYTGNDRKIYLSSEVLKIKVSSDKKTILKSVGDRTLLNGYKTTIDEKYLIIKEFKERLNNNSTLGIIKEMRTSLIECRAFYIGNRFFMTDEFDVLYQKYLESAIISYSMQTDYRNHLNCFDDFDIKVVLLYGNSNKIISWLQRNKISRIKYYPSENLFFTTATKNFFSKGNISFLKDEIAFHEGKTNNWDLRREVQRIFNNICLISSYVEVEVVQNLLPLIINFIKELDFKIEELSFLGHPIIHDNAGFSKKDLLLLAKLLKDNGDNQSYLLTNCLWGLEQKGFKFEETHSELLNYITKAAVIESSFHLLRPLNKLLTQDGRKTLGKEVFNRLSIEFSKELYYEAILNGLELNHINFRDKYSEAVEKTLSKNYVVLLENCNPYTGLNNSKQEILNKFIEIVFILDKNYFRKELLYNISQVHKYYHFILNVEDYDEDTSFELSWLLINSSEIVFKEMVKSKALIKKVNELIKESGDIKILKAYATLISYCTV